MADSEIEEDRNQNSVAHFVLAAVILFFTFRSGFVPLTMFKVVGFLISIASALLGLAFLRRWIKRDPDSVSVWFWAALLGAFAPFAIFLLPPEARWRSVIYLGLGIALLTGVAGCWFRQRWGKPIVVAGLILAIPVGLEFLHLTNYAWWGYPLLAIGLSGHAWQVWKSHDPPPSDSDDSRAMTSLVLLLSDPIPMSAEYIAKCVEHAWEIPPAENDEDEAGFSVIGEPPLMMIYAKPLIEKFSGFFSLNVLSRPYFDEPETVAEECRELRQAKMIREHTAWISLDLIGDPPDRLRTEAYQYIAKLLAEFYDDRVIGIGAPGLNFWAPVNPDTAQALLADDPIEAVFEPNFAPVISVSEDDPRMKEAYAAARRDWPQFVDAFEKSEAKTGFAVKTRVSDGENAEFPWIEIDAIEGERVFGKLGNELVDVKGFDLDDRMTVRFEDVVDWVYMTEEGMQGGFTIKAIGEIMNEPQSGPQAGEE